MRVILADDAAMIRQGVARLLTDVGVEVVGEAGSADELLARIPADRPDVVVVDIRMPPTFTDEGLRAAREIRRSYPAVSVLVLSQYVHSAYAMRLLADGTGHVGYLLKDRVVDVGEFVAALRRLRAGGSVVDPALVAELVAAPRRDDPLARLTAREREVLALMAEGRTDRGIAEKLFVTQKTVEAHVRSILRKLDLPANGNENRRVHAVLAFLQAAPPG